MRILHTSVLVDSLLNNPLGIHLELSPKCPENRHFFPTTNNKKWICEVSVDNRGEWWVGADRRYIIFGEIQRCMTI